MSSKTCSNCGAVLQNAEKMKYCPYCSAEFGRTNADLEYDKFIMKHEETVRHNKWKEKHEDREQELREQEIRNRSSGDGCLTEIVETVGFILLAIILLIVTGISNFFDWIGSLF